MVSRKQKDEEFEDDFMDEMDDTPPTIDPYAVLGLETEATDEDVRRAYRKMALKHHPDKASESDKTAANQKFQEIAFAYAVLGDVHRRKRYDLTGSTAEVLDDDQDFDWLSFYREQFEDLVNQQNIKKISDDYKGSTEERNDLVKAYTRGKGDLNFIYENVLLSDILEDDERFRQILDEEIEEGNIESLPAYSKETDATREKAKTIERKRREKFDKKNGKDAVDKAKAKQKAKKSGGAGDISDLAALIQQRQKARSGNFFSSLEAKYAPPSKARGKKRGTPMDEDEPSEEAFQAARARLDKAKNGGRATKKKKIESEDEEESEAIATDSDESESEEEEEEVPVAPKSRKRAPPTRSSRRGKAKA